MRISTAVGFIIFNRPEETARTLERIAGAKPPKLFVVADGPRPDMESDARRCAQTRAVLDRVDWDCEVLWNASETNMGCNRRVSTGLTWLFENVEEAIVIEDDCLPEPSFFPYCEQLLREYRQDERVMMISGCNYLPPEKQPPHSYYFSKYGHVWGWATWRRAWRLYDPAMRHWPEIRDEGWMEHLYTNRAEAKRRLRLFNKTYNNELDTWGYRWTFAKIINSGLSIRPCKNLVSNIGFGDEATHTKADSSIANFPSEPMEFPLRPPPFMLCDHRLDRLEEKILARMRNNKKGFHKYLPGTGLVAGLRSVWRQLLGSGGKP